MRVEIITHPGTGNSTIILNRNRRLTAMSEHHLRDLEFELARRRAMSRTCPAEDGEHTCSLAPEHGEPHLCRGCTRQWRSS